MIFNIGGTKHQDALIFQVSEDFIEVAAVRRAHGEERADMQMTELLYTDSKPRVTPTKKTLDELAANIGKLADTAVTSPKLKEAKFVIADAKIVCIFVAPLSTHARTVYAAKLKEQIKITLPLLQSAYKKGEVIQDTLKDVPTTYATYGVEIESVALNGYATERPLGKMASRIEVTVAHYLTLPEVWSAVGAVLERTFHRELIYKHRDEAVALESDELSREIYTGDELRTIGHDIL
jgi:hypothetical protein